MTNEARGSAKDKDGCKREKKKYYWLQHEVSGVKKEKKNKQKKRDDRGGVTEGLSRNMCYCLVRDRSMI